jgi:hypothetical protein
MLRESDRLTVVGGRIPGQSRILMNDVRSSLMLDDESELEADNLSWEDEQGFGLTDTDLQTLTSMGWMPEDLTIEEDQLRYRQYLAKKQ